MYKYVLYRLLWTLVVLIAVAFVIFTVLYFCPGDPALYKLGNNATQEDINYLNHQWGLDRPYLVQLGDFMLNGLLKLDFGTSWNSSQPIWPELFRRIPRTFIINLFSLVINVVIGLFMGIYAGVNGGKWQDSLIMMIAMVFVSLPSFWVALMMILLFAVKLRWLPSQGMGSWKNYVMPIASSTLNGIANNSRQTRSAILEVFREDYITTARAKGVPERSVIYKHMLPNALMPIVTSLGGALAHLISGAAITERIFGIPGVGDYLLTGCSTRDYPVVRATTLFLCLFSTLVMLATDLVYCAIDPRIKARYSSRGGK
jgi:peptide/nickel transport system permease protein